MSSVPKDSERTQQASPDKSGTPTFNWQLTHTSVFDTVKLIMPPSQVLPIVFVPGIMGTNLCTNSGKPIWLLNSTGGQPIGLAWEWARKGPAGRQTILHPKRTRVYSGGDVPGRPAGTIQNVKDFVLRGWGEVGQTSYHEFLHWLEQKLNGEGFDPANWSDFFYASVSSPSASATGGPPKLFPGIVMEMAGLPSAAERGHKPDPITSDDLLQRAKFRFPVYACGYNWLESNALAADRLKDRVQDIIAENNVGRFRCCQVILVTHSMGGLVARACAQLAGMEAKIAGIVHGVMPAVGAAVAYRRCKVGMGDEDFAAGLVIGSNGVEVTAVFAQAPGALQLLPSGNYIHGWLKVHDEHGKLIAGLPKSDPYTEIYLRKDRWWGLVREEWLNPIGGRPIPWNEFADNIALAKNFHGEIAGKYHPNTFVFYGAGEGSQASFETIRWSMKIGSQPASGSVLTNLEMLDFSHQQVREDGKNTIYLGGEKKFGQQSDQAGFGDSSLPDVETSFRQVRCDKQDGRGDGTVPASSGMFPRASGGPSIRQQFRLEGFSHEPAFKNATAQRVTHYAITKIAARARVS